MPAPRRRYLPALALLCLSISAASALAGAYFWMRHASRSHLRPGDPGDAFLLSAEDPRFPDSRAWARAGVQGGVPFRQDTRVVRRVAAGEDLQAAVDDAARAGGGVVLLAAGTYALHQRLDMRSGVILRGTDPEKTILENHLRGTGRDAEENVGVLFRGVERAGIEDVTLLHPSVKETDPSRYESFENDHAGIDDLRVGHVNLYCAVNCWVDHCRLLFAGTNPLVVRNSVHVTLRDNVVDGSFNKGDGGHGYYIVVKSMYVLCYRETVRNIRHFSIQEGSKYCVVLDGEIEVDINFHGFDGGHNLVENCRFHRRKKHLWPPIGWYAQPSTEGNCLYRIHVPPGKQGPGNIIKKTPSDPSAVFTFCTIQEGVEMRPSLRRLEGPAPMAGTLYPMASYARLQASSLP